ncbi:MAG TPA: hypothetical protein V6C57_00280, partial [Coleofasciculaceae cyanobacterium]
DLVLQISYRLAMDLAVSLMGLTQLLEAIGIIFLQLTETIPTEPQASKPGAGRGIKAVLIAS